MTITKDSLVEMIHNEVGLNKREAKELIECFFEQIKACLLYTSPSPRDKRQSRMPSSA